MFCEEIHPLIVFHLATPYVCEGQNVLASGVDYQNNVKIIINDQIITDQVKDTATG